MNTDFACIWSQENRLKLNKTKTQPILVGWTKLNFELDNIPPINVIETIVPYCLTIKNLEIIINDTLT